jgi:hypothetical protein
MPEGFHGARAEVGHSEQEQRQKWHVEQEKEELGGQQSKGEQQGQWKGWMWKVYCKLFG